jgi:lipopolysaccharide export system protein LptA
VTATRHQTVIRALRGSLAAALLLFLAVVGLYLFGREGKPEPAPASASTADGEDFAVRGEGFEFALTKGDQVVFEIRGREQRSDLEGKVELHDVLIAMERGDGLYKVQGKRALYDHGTQEARLEGSVVIRGPRELVIETDWLDLAEGGSKVHARDGVRFASGIELRGRADVLEANLDSRVLALRGAIEVASAATARVPFQLATAEMVFRDEAGSVVARGGVELRNGDSRLRAQRLHLFLEPESRELELARLLTAVEGELATSSSRGRAVAGLGAGAGGARGASLPITVRATSLEVRFDPRTGEPVEVDLRGLERKPARVVQAQPDGSVATLTLVGLDGEFVQGALRRADLHGPVWLTQGGLNTRRGAERQVKALAGEARFDPVAGGLDGVTLVGEVWLRDADALATGDRAYVDMRRSSFEIMGAPAQIEHPRGTLDAPRAVYRRDAGILQADGGVAAVLREGGAALVPGLGSGGSSDQPLRVEAREAIWEAEPSSVRFLGEVRAWQGANTLFAEQLRGEPDRGWMTASGGVRTLWVPAPEEGEAAEPTTEAAPAVATAAEEAAGDDVVERPGGPLEITAAEMTYSETEQLLVYTGTVRAIQDWTTLACERMTVEMEGDDGEADEIHCEDSVRIVDSRNARTLEGDRAIYYPEVPEVEVFGDPLTMEDSAGNKVEGGRHFVYDLDRGSSRLTARAAEEQ